LPFRPTYLPDGLKAEALAGPGGGAEPTPGESQTHFESSKGGSFIDVHRGFETRPLALGDAQPTRVMAAYGADGIAGTIGEVEDGHAVRFTIEGQPASAACSRFLIVAYGFRKNDLLRFADGLLAEGALCTERATAPPCGAGAVVGRPYPYNLYTHCGIARTVFDGRWWELAAAADAGGGNAPPGFGNPQDQGAMTLTSRDAAEYVSHGGARVRFRPGRPPPDDVSCV
jgi:hypothetical protein